MKKVLILLAMMSLQLVSAQEAEAKKAVETFFTAFNKADVTTVKSVCAEKMILQSVEVHTIGNKFTEETDTKFYAWLQSMTGKVNFEERTKDYKVVTDGHIAHVWVNYEFYVGGVFSHKGVDSFELVKFKDGWKIVYLIDTRMP
ncbi:nuclear transport factor 2 family protein [Flavobacterium sp. RHBU_3]|uniref:nuclear transport factor 2 family protein n=1 Tax=Flavobacterium sp. RHBU_3 TaxID=3391184 RepID=UPI003985630A